MSAVNAPELGEIFETFVSADRKDSKGREIGFIVGFRDNGIDFYAWVQCARRTTLTNWSDFGVRQRSKLFTSQVAARTWAYMTARARIAKLP